MCPVIGFPHGNSTSEVKVFEARRAVYEGANEIDMVVNIGRVKSGKWEYVQKEIAKVNEAVVAGGAILKVIFENDCESTSSFHKRVPNFRQSAASTLIQQCSLLSLSIPKFGYVLTGRCSRSHGSRNHQALRDMQRSRCSIRQNFHRLRVCEAR